MKECIERRAVKIAAVIMYRAGLCRHDTPLKCRKVWTPTEQDCVKCIERWLLNRARREIEGRGTISADNQEAGGASPAPTKETEGENA